MIGKGKIKGIVCTVIILLGVILIATLLYWRYVFIRPNIIFITVDALRPDHLSCFGYQRKTSPNIDRLAEKGVSFLNCFATSSSTIKASPALLTGRYLTISNKRSLSFNDSLISSNILDQKFTTLAEYLKNFGYFTAAFLNNVLYKKGKGFEQGFDYYCTSWREGGNAEEITSNVLTFLNNYRSNKPFFIWAHYLDTHAPYPPIDPVHSKLPPKEYFVSFMNDELYNKNDKILKLRQTSNSDPYISEGYLPPVVFRDGKYNLNYYVARYDSAILYADHYIGKLLANIEDDTVVILTADHGESLGEHGQYFDHGANIYDEVLRVPLIIKDSSYFKGGRKISKVAASVDIVPTVLSIIDRGWYAFHKNRFNGIDLKMVAEGKDKRRYVYAYNPNTSIRDVHENIKYIFKPGNEQLYFCPDELSNYINDNSSAIVVIRRNLRRSLRSWSKHYPILSDMKAKVSIMDEKTKSVLSSLGYL